MRNRDILISSIAATLAGAITLLANMAQWSMLFGPGHSHDEEEGSGFGGLIGSLLLIILAPIAATPIQLVISRSREYGADETGADIHRNPESLARALQRLEMAGSLRPLPVNPAAAHLFIVNPPKGLAMSRLFSTHPPIGERVRLRQMQRRLLAVYCACLKATRDSCSFGSSARLPSARAWLAVAQPRSPGGTGGAGMRASGDATDPKRPDYSPAGAQRPARGLKDGQPAARRDRGQAHPRRTGDVPADAEQLDLARAASS